MADIDFKNSVNADTAYVDGHKVKLIAVPDGSLELPISANDEYGYVVDANGKKHRVLLVTFLEGEPDFKSAPNADTAYMTVNSQKVKVRLGAKLNGTQYLSNSANVNDCYTEDDDSNKHRTILVSEPTGTLELPTSETSDSAYVIDNDGNKHKVRLFAVLAGGTTVVEVIVSGVPPLSLIGAVENSVEYVKAYGGLLQGGVPSGYTAVEYIEGDGASYIDTGTYSSNLTRTEVVVKASTTSSALPVFGDYQADGSDIGKSNALYYVNGTPGFYVTDKGGTIPGTSETNKTKLGNYDTSNFHNIVVDLKNRKGVFDGTETSLVNTTIWTSTRTQVLFARRATNGAVGLYSACRLKSCKIYEDDVLVRDFIPAKRNSDSVIGMFDTVSNTFFTNAGTGTFIAGNEIAPTPSDPVDLVCNNGALKILDKSQWTIFTNPTSIAGQGVFISSDGKWYNANDRGAGCAIPLTIGKQYTLVIHQKTAALGTTLRFGQSPQATPTAAGVQLTDWYRGTIADGQMVSFVAKLPYLVMQFSAVATEAGMVQEAVEVLEAQGGDYTFVDSITASGTQYIDTGVKPDNTMKVEIKFKPTNNTSTCCLFGGRDSTSGDRKAFAVWSSINNSAGKPRFDFGSTSTTIASVTSTTNWNIVIKDGASNTFNGMQIDNETATFETNYNACLFAMNTGSSTVASNMAGQVAYCRIWKAGVLVRDFIPAIRNSDNVVGMYDAVSGTFFENQGTGTFVAGTVIGDGEVLKLTPSNDTAGVANLLKINNYVDTQEILTGLINHQVGIYVFDGTEDWTEGSTTSLSISKTSLGTSTTVLPSTSTDIVCTHYQALGTSAVEDAIWVGASNVNFRVRATYATVSDWKTFLAAQYAAGTPVIIVYPLATPQDEVAPVPQTMQTVAGDNQLDIVQAGMSGLEVSATYMKGVSVTISEIEDANIGNSVEVVIA